jgi:hypothetical protein
VPPSVWIAGLLGAACTWIQLYLRFFERRPFEAPRTAALFGFIGVFAGAVSGAVAWLPLLPVGGEIAGVTLGLGTTVPFTRAPGSSLLRARSTRTSTEITRALNSLWEIAALMANRLDRMLARAKSCRVDQVVRKIDALTREDEYPPFERVNSVLGVLVGNFTDKNRDVYTGRLAAAYQDCKNDRNPLTRLIGLAYDMGQEGAILDLVRENTRPGTRTDRS